MNRRQFIALAGSAPLCYAASSPEPAIETHVHLFSSDLAHFPGHKNAWTPTPAPLEDYLKFAKSVGITNAIHVSAEPYQNDHRYLGYTLEHAPAGFLKGTILMDPTLPETPDQMAKEVKLYPGKIVALRIHCTRARDAAPTTSGPIRDRDLKDPNVPKAWRKVGELGLAVQAHFQYWFAPEIGRLGRMNPDTRIIIDHFGHAGVGGAVKGPKGWSLSNAEPGYRDPKDFNLVLELAKLPQATLKVSSLQYSSREPHPHRDIKPLARAAFDAFGPDRMMWGSLGHSREEFLKKEEVFSTNFDFLSTTDRTKIRSGTARKFFRF